MEKYPNYKNNKLHPLISLTENLNNTVLKLTIK